MLASSILLDHAATVRTLLLPHHLAHITSYLLDALSKAEPENICVLPSHFASLALDIIGTLHPYVDEAFQIAIRTRLDVLRELQALLKRGITQIVS